MLAALLLSTTVAADSHLWLQGQFHAEIEGPATDAAGNVYAVNYANKGTIGKINPDGEASLYIRLPAGSVGNGIRFNNSGQMFIADYTGHNIWRYNGVSLQLYLHEPGMHQPNDLAITQRGTLFATDPNWRNKTGQLWRIAAAGEAQLVKGDMGTTNGIAVSEDQRWLYVNESAQRRIWRFTLTDADQAKDPQLFYQFDDYGLDGMRCATNGDIFIARYGKGTVAQLSADGRLIKEYKLHGKYPTNVAFSPDQRYLYVTMQKSGDIERIALPVLTND